MNTREFDFDSEQFLNPLVTVDTVLLTLHEGTIKALVINRAQEPYKGKTALPGGFLLKGEDTQKAANRVLKEKAGVENVYLEQLYTFDAPGRDPRGPLFSVTYMALVPYEQVSIQETENTQKPRFIALDELEDTAFDHADIIAYALERLRAKIEYTNIVFSILPKHFTLSELQNAYEVILDKELDKRNFRRKFLQLDLIEQTEEMRTGQRQRPAALYAFKKDTLSEVSKFM